MTAVFALLGESADPPERWRGEPAPDPEPRSGAKLGRVLVVDDDELLRRVVGRMLEEAGYEVTLAGDGLEALSCISGSGVFDAVVADLRMPRMGGRTLGDRLAVLHPELPILYISGYTSDWQPELATRATSAFLAKPFAESELLQSLRALLRNR
jgi:CheY-like chemotaxis protein